MEDASVEASTEEVVEASTGRLEYFQEATSLEASDCFHGSSNHSFHGSFHSLLPWKIVEASLETMEASMEVVEASIEIAAASVVVNVPRLPWKPMGASTISMEACGNFRSL